MPCRFPKQNFITITLLTDIFEVGLDFTGIARSAESFQSGLCAREDAAGGYSHIFAAQVKGKSAGIQ